MVDWVYDELVLAADLVSHNDWKGVRRTSAAAIELSTLLKQGQLHRDEDLPSDFRTPSSIQRKSYDLATADQKYHGKQTRGGRNDAQVIAAFARIRYTCRHRPR